MTNPGLVSRMERCIRRSVAWYEKLLNEYASLGEETTPEEFEALRVRHAEEVRVTVTLEREFSALLKEWRAAPDLSEEEREQVRALGGRAASLAEEVAAQTNRLSGLLGSHLKTMRASLGRARKGHALIGRYRAGDMPQADLLDRRA